MFSAVTIAPNPFNPSTVISFDTPTATTILLGIYVVSGRRVRHISLGVQPGRHAGRWDGRNEIGAEVGSGVYFITLRAEVGSATRKAFVVR